MLLFLCVCVCARVFLRVFIQYLPLPVSLEGMSFGDVGQYTKSGGLCLFFFLSFFNDLKAAMAVYMILHTFAMSWYISVLLQ